MPRLIRQMLQERMLSLREVQLLLEDFRMLTGLDAGLLDMLGRPVGPSTPRVCSPFCALVQERASGCSSCAVQKQAVLAKAGTGAAAGTCEYGLRELAVPVRVAGEAVAYLVFGGHANAAPDPATVNRMRHLCERGGHADPSRVASAVGATRVVPREAEAAHVRWMQLAAWRISQLLTHHAAEEAARPPALERALGEIRSRCSESLSLKEVARRAGVSAAHLCRLFQQHTGLRFRDYLARARLTHARELLAGTRMGVTEVCFAAGFQSVSSFNRVFRASEGVSPSQYRAAQPAVPDV
jgi:AraC-like DNA-binding protein/ligand-binding sensor protein